MYDYNEHLSKAVRTEIERRMDSEKDILRPCTNKFRLCRKLRKSIRILINKASN